MISTDAGLATTREALANLEDTLLDLSRNRNKYHPATFAILAEPIETEIRRLRGEIDTYISAIPVTGAPAQQIVPAG
jgi:hypothetical protein